MQLTILLVVVCAISSAGSDAAHLEGAGWRMLAALAGVAIAPLTALVAHSAIARGLNSRVIDPRQSQRRLERWGSLVAWLWAGGSLVVLYVARLPDVVRAFEFTLAWPLLDDLLILAPLLAGLVLVWIALYRIERTLRHFAAPGEPSPEVCLRKYLELRVRHHLGLTLLPALLILGVLESAVKLELTTGVADPRSWWLWTALIAAAVLALPLVLKWLWQAQRVDDSPLKRRLLESCRRLGCPVRDIVVWRTGGTVANAAVAGLFPGLRTIFLSDALLARLSDDEIDVVVRHEAAHLAQRHLWQRLALLGLPLLVYFAVQTQWPQLLGQLQALFTSVGIAPVWQASLLIPLAALLYALVVVGWLSRLHEHDADLAACCARSPGDGRRGTLAGELTIDPNAVLHLHSALAKLVGGSDEYRKGGWLHPSVLQRVEFLLMVGHQPPLAPRFRGRLLRLSCSLLAACLAALAAGLWPV